MNIKKLNTIFVILAIVIADVAYSNNNTNSEANDTFKMIISSARNAGNGNSEKKFLENMGINNPMTDLEVDHAIQDSEAFQTIKKGYNTATKTYLKQFSDNNNSDMIEKSTNDSANNNVITYGNDKFSYNTTDNFS